jgi:ubiquinone/menaquinone biosynthesis C-methylase UbiE
MTLEWHTESQKKWDEMSTTWNQNSREMWETGSRKTIIPFFTPYLDPQNGKILDAGCGDGYGTRKMASLGLSMVGIDLSSEMIEKAKAQSTGTAIDFLQADITKLPFAPNSFSGILSINCLEWVQSPLDGLEELYRVLQPNGHLCLGILGPTAAPRQNSYQRLYGQQVVCNTMMPWECATLAEENGFEITDQQGVYKQGVNERLLEPLPLDLKQALTFMWLFILRKKG